MTFLSDPGSSASVTWRCSCSRVRVPVPPFMLMVWTVLAFIAVMASFTTVFPVGGAEQAAAKTAVAIRRNRACMGRILCAFPAHLGYYAARGFAYENCESCCFDFGNRGSAGGSRRAGRSAPFLCRRV